MKTLLRAAFLAIFTILSFNLSASHIAGGTIAYECLGGNDYNIRLSLYRDCSGAWMSSQVVVNFSNSCAIGTPTVATLALSNLGGTEVSQLCPSQIANSTCNGGTYPGMEEYVYEGIVSLAPCNSWKVFYSLCCRNTANNVTAQQSLYLEAEINTSFSCNSSPIIASAPTFYTAINMPATIDLRASDPDCDSLHYSLVCAKTSGGTPITYLAPYSCSVPMVGMTINSATGEINFTPSAAGNFVIAVQINQYDRISGTWKGATTVDFQVAPYASANNNPTVSGPISNISGSAVQAGAHGLSLCPGGNGCFDIIFSDIDSGDSLLITSDITNLFPGATVMQTGTNPATATICFTDSIGINGCQSFVVEARDSNCPIAGISRVRIKLWMEGTTAGADQTICAGDNAQLSVIGGTAFTWSAISGPAINVGTNFSCNPCSTPVATPTATTTYVVTSNLTGCNSDTVTVNVAPTFTYTASQSDTTICQWDTIQFNITPSPAGTYTYAWTPSYGLNSTNIANPIFVSDTIGGIMTYVVDITNAQGCIKQELFMIDVINMSLFANTINATCNDSGFAMATAFNGTSPFSYTWNTSPVINGPAAYFPTPGVYMVNVVDANGCSQDFSVPISGPTAYNGYDMRANLTAVPQWGNLFRPGRPVALYLDGFNSGCDSVSCDMRLVLDPTVHYSGAVPAPDLISGDTLIWSFTDMSYNSPHLTPVVTIYPDTNGQIGDTICFELIICPAPNMFSNAPTSKMYCYQLQASMDPNSKSVYPVRCNDYIEDDELMTYTINFQNVGTASAIDVYILDEMDDDLDLTTVNVVGTSHDPMNLSVIGNNKLKFDFPSIMLPDSASNNAASKGYVMFEVYPKAGLADGTEITNDVGIYFDFNAPVITNTVRSEIIDDVPTFTSSLVVDSDGPYDYYGETYTESGTYMRTLSASNGCDSVVTIELTITTGIDEIASFNPRIYPNPTTGKVYIDLGEQKDNVSVRVQDLTGKSTLYKEVHFKSNIELDLSAEPQGLYFLHIQADDAKRVVKILRTK